MKYSNKKAVKHSRYAGFGSRSLAFAIDFLIQAVLLVTIFIVCRAFFIKEFDIIILEKSPIVTACVIYGTYFITGVSYGVLCDTLFSGVTIGKKILGLRVSGINFTNIKFVQSLKRNIIKHTVDIIAAPFRFVDIQSYSDEISNTRVVCEKVYMRFRIPEIDLSFISWDQARKLRITQYEYDVLSEYFARKDSLGEIEPKVFKKLQKYFCWKFNAGTNDMTEQTMIMLMWVYTVWNKSYPSSGLNF